MNIQHTEQRIDSSPSPSELRQSQDLIGFLGKTFQSVGTAVSEAFNSRFSLPNHSISRRRFLGMLTVLPAVVATELFTACSPVGQPPAEGMGPGSEGPEQGTNEGTRRLPDSILTAISSEPPATSTARRALEAIVHDNPKGFDDEFSPDKKAKSLEELEEIKENPETIDEASLINFTDCKEVGYQLYDRELNPNIHSVTALFDRHCIKRRPPYPNLASVEFTVEQVNNRWYISNLSVPQ